MTHELLHRYAKDKDSNLVSIEDAEKGNEYFCPGCGRNFILRKSGNTGKGSRRPHFAHNNFDESISKCEPDIYLHETFKIELFDLLEESIKSNSFAGVKVYPPLGFDPWPEKEVYKNKEEEEE